MYTRKEKVHITEVLLALVFIVGSFSIFSVAFGIQKSHIFEISNTIYTNKDAQQHHTQIEKKILSFQDDHEEEIEARYILQHLHKLGAIRARSFLVGDLDTGEVIFERKSHTKFPIASVTKYMTAFTAAEFLKPNELAKITAQKLKVEGNRGRLKIGDTLSIKTLLYPLLLVSSNDAGEIIAQQRTRSGFISKMNTLAKKHRLHNTNFEDPTGLSKNNVSTARDLFKMMRVIHKEYPQIIQISDLNSIQTNGYTWRNINRSSALAEFKGGKTGYTNAARQTSIGYYQIKLANDQIKNIGVVILQSGTRQQDTRNILDYLKRYVAYL